MRGKTRACTHTHLHSAEEAEPTCAWTLVMPTACYTHTTNVSRRLLAQDSCRSCLCSHGASVSGEGGQPGPWHEPARRATRDKCMMETQHAANACAPHSTVTHALCMHENTQCCGMCTRTLESRAGKLGSREHHTANGHCPLSPHHFSTYSMQVKALRASCRCPSLPSALGSSQARAPQVDRWRPHTACSRPGWQTK